jgi:hypothetical protein
MESIIENLGEFLAWDIAETRTTGLRPVALERKLEGRLKELQGFRVHGIVDRIDRRADGSWRVVDYKTRWTRSPNLRALVKKGELHQLPIYAELAGVIESGKFEGADICALEDTTRTMDHPHYPAEALAEDRPGFFKRVSAELGEIRLGRFPIIPEDGEYGHCSRCAFSFVCRKSHGPSRTRALQASTRTS